MRELERRRPVLRLDWHTAQLRAWTQTAGRTRIRCRGERETRQAVRSRTDMYRSGPTVGARVPASTASVCDCWCSSSTVVWRLSLAHTRRDDPRAFGVVGGHGVHFATPPCVRDDPGRNNPALQQTLLSDLCAVAVRVCGQNHSTASAKSWACSRELAAPKHTKEGAAFGARLRACFST